MEAIAYNPRDNTPNNQLGNCGGCRQNNRPDNHNSTPGHEHYPSAKVLTDEKNRNRSNDTSYLRRVSTFILSLEMAMKVKYIIKSDDIPLHTSIGIPKVPCKPVLSTNNATHHALVIAQQEEGLTRAGRDSRDEGLATEAVLPHICRM